jgi:4-oxalocrotonate tautomerase
MPNIEMFIVEGYSSEKKSELIAALTKATVDAVGAPIESVRVMLTEIPATEFGVAGVTVAARQQAS